MGRKFLNCYMLCEPLNRWQLHTAEGTRRVMQQLFRERGKLTEAKQVAFMRDQPHLS
jgi:hypothetical protein